MRRVHPPSPLPCGKLRGAPVRSIALSAAAAATVVAALLFSVFLFFGAFSTRMEAVNAIAGRDEMTPLQKHADFFDRNKDGLIYPSETFRGLRAIGCGIALSTAGTISINGFLGLSTRPGKLPSPLFPIYVRNIHKGKHGSDTGAYDGEGRFVPEKFEAIFEKHARINQTALTSKELMDMLEANRIPGDKVGRIASAGEWRLLYHVCKDKDGLLSKEDVRGVYDGSVFYRLEKNEASQQKSNI